MNASRFALPALALLLCAHGAPAQTISEETLQRMQQQIRKDRFDHVLPRAMRDNNVDMWIHVVRDRNPDPIARNLGGESGVFVFTDRGGDRIERAILGMTDEALWEDEAYDLFAGEGPSSTASRWSTWSTCECRNGAPASTCTSPSTTAPSSPRAASSFPIPRIRRSGSSASPTGRMRARRPRPTRLARIRYLSSPHQRRSRSAIAASEPWSDGS